MRFIDWLLYDVLFVTLSPYSTRFQDEEGRDGGFYSYGQDMT